MSTNDENEKREYEERLQRRLKILKTHIDAGKVVLPAGLGVDESLLAMRYASDGSVDLSTVDAAVRALAIGVEHFHDREELKKALPLADIQSAYFAFLHRNLGHYYEAIVKRGLTPYDAAMSIAHSSVAEKVAESLPDFLAAVEEFWSGTAEAVYAHIEDSSGNIKGVFGGDLFPSYKENLASKCGLYTDTLILPDPFLRTKRVFTRFDTTQKVYYSIKHGLNLLQYRDLACAEVQPPIVVIAPDRTALEAQERDFIHELGQRDAVLHAAKIFGRNFASFEELSDYAAGLNSLETLVPSVRAPNRVLFDTEWGGTLAEQLQRAASDELHGQLFQTDNIGLIVALQAVGRMATSNELLIKAHRFRGTPVIDAPTSWQYFVWKLEYDASRVERDKNLTALHVVRGLQNSAENCMEWLGSVPPEALIEVRKTGAIKEIRAILGQGVESLASADPLDFQGTSEKVINNIQSAFADHRKRVADLTNRKWRFAGSEIGTWLVVGSLEVAAAATGFPVYGLAAIAADQLLDVPKLKEIPGSIEELAKRSRELKQSPVGLLFKLSKR